MKKLIIPFSIALLSAVITSCASMTYTIDISAAPVGTKTGISKTGVLFNRFKSNKSYGIAEAAHNGKITGGVAVVDEKVKLNFFANIYYKKQIIVHGN